MKKSRLYLLLLIILFLISGCTQESKPIVMEEIKNDGQDILVNMFNENFPEKYFNYSQCIKNPQGGEYKSGEILIDFVQDVTKEDIDELFSPYNLSSNEIRFPGRHDYRVDFSGNKEYFLDYLKGNGFSQRSSRVYFLLSSNTSINCAKAKEIFYSYPNVTISTVYCIFNVWGVVKVPRGEENKWICELQKSNIVSNAGLNHITHASS